MSDSNQYDQYVRVVEPFNVILCRNCKYCINPDAFKRHLQDKHQAIPLKIRLSMESHMKSLNLQNPKDVVMSGEAIPAIEGLAVIDGVKCAYEGCSHCELESSIQSHCREHKWNTFTGKQSAK
jgi:Orsellinic acid/F9775 biosynthesis cluster protein D